MKEKGKISDDAIRLISLTSEGSVRDAISLLDRALISQSINENKQIEEIDSPESKQPLEVLLEEFEAALKEENTGKLKDLIAKLHVKQKSQNSP